MHEIVQALMALCVCIGAFVIMVGIVVASLIVVDIREANKQEREQNGK